jgi:protein KRI1
LTASDAQLNEFVGLKKLAPYRPQKAKEGDLRKYGKKKRLREWRKEGDDDQIKALLRPEKAESVIIKDSSEPKKKRKSRKAKGEHRE